MTRRRGLGVAAVALVALAAAACAPAPPPGAGSTTTRQSPPGTTGTTTSSSTTTTVRPSTTTTAPAVPAKLFGRVWSTVPTTAHVVALTFDAGANADGMASILATLQRTGTPASFFLTGNFARQFAAAGQLPRSGYRLGDHTVDHPHLPTLSDAAVRSEVLDAQATIRSVTGADPAPFFRFPYGDSDARTLGLVNAMGFVAVGWTVDTLGWKGTSGGVSVGEVVARVTGALRPGEIVLMHVGSNPDDHSTLDADALPAVIDAVRGAGYRMVTLDALLSS